MERKKRLLIAIHLALSVAAGGISAQDDDPATTISDDQISLYKGSVFEASAPEAVRDNRSDPGDRPPLSRVHEEAPPVVPHGVADLLPITREDNWCVDCHLLETQEAGDPTPIPKSHFVDFRNAPNEAGDTLVGARYLCVSCHVALTEAEPLVGNPMMAREVSAVRSQE